MTHEEFVAHLDILRHFGLSLDAYNDCVEASAEKRYIESNPIPEKSPHEQDMEKLHQMMKEHPEGGECFVRSDSIFGRGGMVRWYNAHTDQK